MEAKIKRKRKTAKPEPPVLVYSTAVKHSKQKPDDSFLHILHNPQSK